jgi:hypothetical protein
MSGARLAVADTGETATAAPLQMGCHVIQRERLQPFPTMSTPASGRFRRPRVRYGRPAGCRQPLV